VGNAFDGTELTAEFGVANSDVMAEIFGKKDEEHEKEKEKEKEKEPEKEKEKEERDTKEKAPKEQSKEKKELPFQVQITYTSLSGMKCTRVITKTKEVTEDKNEVEKEIDVTVMGMHANWVAAKCVQKGDLEGAVTNNRQYRAILHDNIEDDIDAAGMGVWESESVAYDAQLNKIQAQQVEAPQPSSTAADLLGSVTNFVSSAFSGTRAPAAPPVANHEDDETQNMMYARRNAQKNKAKWNSRRKY